MSNDRRFELPLSLHYDRAHHLWVDDNSPGGHARVGIDAIGLDALGELAYVTVLRPGTTVRRGDSMGTLEAAKMTTNIVAPVSGTIVARNEAVLRDPRIVNDGPYDAWLVEVDTTDWQREAAELVSGAAIPVFVASENERLSAESGGG